MARKPFLPIHKGKHFCFDERGLVANHEAARLVGQIISDWSRVEHQKAIVLAAILGDNPNAGVALFSAIRNTRTQTDAIRAVADNTIADPDLRIMLDAVWNAVGAIGKGRDDIAHGVFGWSFDLPELTLWIRSSDLASYEAEAWARFNRKPPDPTANHDKLEKLISTYRTSDFNDLLNAVAEAKEMLSQYYGLVRHAQGATSPEYLQLSSRPLVDAELSRLRSDAKTYL